MVAVDCPHRYEGRASCPGCARRMAEQPTPDDYQCFDGIVTARVYSDSEGDIGVIGGTHDFTTVEDVTASCGCEYVEDEYQELIDKIAEEGNDPPEPDPDEAHDRMREGDW